MAEANSKRFMLISTIRKFDSYGHPVNLSLNGDPTYKTLIGGIATLISRLLIVAYFLYEIKGVLSKESSIKTTIQYRNLVTDKQVYDINETQFDMAVKLSFHSGNATRLERYQTYMNFYIAQLEQYWEQDVSNGSSGIKWSETYKDLIPCPETRFANATEFTSVLHLYEGFLCTSDTNYQLQGSLSSSETKQIWINFVECDQNFLDEYYPGQQCEKDEEEVKTALNDIEITLVIANQYFDGEEFTDSSIKWDYRVYFFTINPDISNCMYYKLSQNYVTLQDSSFTDIFENQQSFVSHSFSSYFLHTVDGYVYPYLAFAIMLDETSTSFERSTKTVLEAISNTGGIIGFIVVSVGFSIKFLQDFYFNQAVLQRIFLYESKKGSKQETNQEQQQSSGADIEKVLMRVPFKISFKQYCRNLIPRVFCLGKGKRKGLKKYKLYKTGIKALNKEFDIAYLVKEIRLLKFMSKIFLSKYQRKLLPYFKKNLLEEFRPFSTSSQKQIPQYLWVLAQQSKQGSKKDKRILSNLISTKPDSPHSPGERVVQNWAQKNLMSQLTFSMLPEPQQYSLYSSDRLVNVWRKQGGSRDDEMNLESSINYGEEVNDGRNDEVLQADITNRSQIKKNLEF